MKKILITILILCLAVSLGFAQPQKAGAHKSVGLATLITGAAQGDIIYWDGTSWVLLNIGSNTNVLTSNGTIPNWGAGGGSDSSWTSANADTFYVGTATGGFADLAVGAADQVAFYITDTGVNLNQTSLAQATDSASVYAYTQADGDAAVEIRDKGGHLMQMAMDNGFHFKLTNKNMTFYTNNIARFTIQNTGGIIFNDPGNNVDFRAETAGEDSAFVVDGADGDIYMEGLGSGTGTALSRVAGTDEIVEESSSRRFKDNISDWDVDPSALMGLRPRQFDWNEKSSVEGLHDYGMIAEEVREVLPEAIHYKDGEVNAWSQSKVIALLVATVQDQQKQIDELKKAKTWWKFW